MKCIGKTGSGVLLEASNDEVAHLVGYYSVYDARNKGGIPTATGVRLRGHLEVGDEIEVDEMYQTLYKIAARRKSCDEIATELEGIAALVRLKDPIKRATDLTKSENSNK